MAEDLEPIGNKLEFEITDDERRHLAHMMKSPGFLVMQKIERSYIDAARASALAQSMSDPLANKELLAAKWAYVVIAERFAAQMKAGVKFELDLLTRNEQPKPDPIELARARRDHVLSGSFLPFRSK
jgi:hypothetical protein